MRQSIISGIVDEDVHSISFGSGFIVLVQDMSQWPRTFVSRTAKGYAVNLNDNACSSWVSLLAGQIVHSDFLTF